MRGIWLCLIVVCGEKKLWSVSAAERETSLLIRAQAELMTSLVALNEALRPSLMIIWRASWENFWEGRRWQYLVSLAGICKGRCEVCCRDRRQTSKTTRCHEASPGFPVSNRLRTKRQRSWITFPSWVWHQLKCAGNFPNYQYKQGFQNSAIINLDLDLPKS